MSVNKNFRITIVKLNNKVLVGRWILRINCNGKFLSVSFKREFFYG